MHPPSSNCLPSDPSQEQGSILVMFVISLLALVAVAGLAIDSGNLYRARLALQSAADAAALDGINHTIVMGNEEFLTLAAASSQEDRESISKYLEEKSEHTVRTNLRAAGYPHLQQTNPVSITGTYYPPSNYEANDRIIYEYQVEVSRKIDYLLMDLIPSFNQRGTTLTVSAKSARNITNVALILDTSNSMACPQSGDCNCLSSDSCPDEGGRKIDALAEAVKNFLMMFDKKDNIVMVPFNIAADSAGTFQSIQEDWGLDYKEATPDQVNAFISYLFSQWRPGSNTNICDALMTAYNDMQEVGPDSQAAYVFFSDGAPTAGRFLFSDSAVSGKKLEPWTFQGSGGKYDYTHYTVSWNKSTSTATYPGPSVLVQTGMIGFGHELPTPPPVGTYYPGADIASLPGDKSKGCGPNSTPKVNSQAEIAQAANEVFAPCLNSLEAHTPGNPAATYGGSYTNASGFAKWREQYYNCAIELSDFIRSRMGVFYVIGLGPKDPGTSSLDDPYQDANDTTYRKDFFLARLANDPAAAALAAQGSEPPSFSHNDSTGKGYAGHKDYNDPLLSKVEKRGKYLATSSANELKLLFELVARKLKLKLAP